MKHADCPIKQDAERMIQLSSDMLKTLRRLKRSLKTCGSCEMGQDCLFLVQVNAAVESALEQVCAEWGLS